MLVSHVNMDQCEHICCNHANPEVKKNFWTDKLSFNQNANSTSVLPVASNNICTDGSEYPWIIFRITEKRILY